MSTSNKAPSRSGSARSGMSEQRKERLMDIQKREQLKGMLVSKFKLKYGEKKDLGKYIDMEVGKFLKNDRLTEDNLRTLDVKISKEAELRDKKEAILEDRKSNAGSVRSRASSQQRKLSGNADARSVASSRRSSQAARSVRSAGRQADQMSQVSAASRATEVYSELAEEDEWAAIEKFNTLLHYEEQKQLIMREKERRRLIKAELDKQVEEKKARENHEQSEKRMYEDLMVEHVKLLGQREAEKADQVKAKINAEKESRDRQMKDEKARKRNEEKQQFRAECELVDRLKEEMENERKLQDEKRRQEKEYFQRMLLENERNKKKAEDFRKEEMKADVLAQEEYAKMLDKQEADRVREFKQRELRAQNFMNRLATGVIAKQQQRIDTENEVIRRYEMERELRARLEDERRIERDRQEKQNMRALLAKQMDEKRRREADEKALNDEQAVIWKHDKANYEEEERRLNDKVRDINKENMEFLQKQMQEKASRHAMRRMNKQEFAYNKALLKEINNKRKTSNYDGSSRVAEGDIPDQ